MKRSVYFLITAILAVLFGSLMLLAPRLVAQGFNLAASGETDALFRPLGATIIGLAVLNFLVRNDPPSATLRAVLWTNLAGHALGFLGDLWTVAVGPLIFAAIASGLVVHLFVGLGALWYLTRGDA